MINIRNKEHCCGCEACYNICPQNCITLTEDEEGFFYPNVNRESCIDCSLCEKVCPMSKDVASHNILSSKAAINDLNEDRLESSSGGMFPIFARYVLSMNGIVCGAVFDKTFKEVRHICIDKIDDLRRIQGSKYLQSRIGECYSEIKKYLDDARIVLFTGTSCQVSGLKSFLRKDYDNLLTIDCLCHGVPSPKIWRLFLSEISQDRDIVSINFRDKNISWHNYYFTVKFKDGTYFSEKSVDNNYMKGFLSDLYLRPSCHNCSFKVENSCSDVTIADFWGVEELFPSIDDDKGVSLVIVHTNKAQKLLSSFDIKNKDVSLNSVMGYNSGFKSIIKPHPNRKKFFKKLSKSDSLNILISKSLKKSLFRRIVDKVKSYI